MAQEQNRSPSPKQQTLGAILVVLPMAIGAYIVFGPKPSEMAGYLWQAAFFATLPGVGIMLALKGKYRFGWFYPALCAGFVVWSLYQAVEA